MSNLGSFIHHHKRLLFFGFLLTFFSCFGQTITVSLYVPELIKAFQLTNTEISGLYAMATMGSAFLLPWIGRYMDTWPLMRFTLFAMTILITALCILSFSTGLWLVMLGFFGMRFGGQGLMSHTAASAMIRGFKTNRGKALSLSALGYPFSEAIMPLTIAFLIGAVGWRTSLQFSAGWMIFIVLPLSLWLLRSASDSLKFPKITLIGGSITSKMIRNPFRLFLDRKFWILAPILFLKGAVGTAVFFFQIQFGESRGWDASWIAGSVSAFAIASAVGMLASGPLVDRLTARMVFPFFMLPFVIGLLLLGLFQEWYIYPICLLFLGLSSGIGNTIKDAVLAEVYSAEIIGTVRSLFAMVTVFSTAIGPVSFGLLADYGFSFDFLYIFSAFLTLFAMLWSLRIYSQFTKSRWKVLRRSNK